LWKKLISSADSTDTSSQQQNTPKSPSRATRTTAIYITGMPFMTVKKVKDILGTAPINIQLRNIGNISWIDQRIVELLVDIHHAERIKNRLQQYSEYDVKSSFDPLSPNSFNWEGDILPESKELVLRRNFITRLSSSVASSNKVATRQHVLNWARQRGVGVQLEKELERQGIILPVQDEKVQSPGSEFMHDHFWIRRKPEEPLVISGAGDYLKRKFNILSQDGIDR